MKTPDAARSRAMRAVKSVNTKPEMLVRRLAHSLGYRFRLHRKDLPGSPDLVFSGRRCVIFVHGCFWHGHDCRRGARRPKDNAGYWRAKITRNVARDARVLGELEEAGWRSIVLGECELRDRDQLEARIRNFLDGAGGALHRSPSGSPEPKDKGA
jgi:DNA mismatch endonuclease (patch repair protein)